MRQPQTDAIAILLWDYVKRDPEHADRRQTGWKRFAIKGQNADWTLFRHDNGPLVFDDTRAAGMSGPYQHEGLGSRDCIPEFARPEISRA